MFLTLIHKIILRLWKVLCFCFIWDKWLCKKNMGSNLERVELLPLNHIILTELLRIFFSFYVCFICLVCVFICIFASINCPRGSLFFFLPCFVFSVSHPALCQRHGAKWQPPPRTSEPLGPSCVSAAAVFFPPGMTDNIPLQPVRRPKRNNSKHRHG